jgi:hypothetical protein
MKILFGRDLFDFLELFEQWLFEMLDVSDLKLKIIF